MSRFLAVLLVLWPTAALAQSLPRAEEHLPLAREIRDRLNLAEAMWSAFHRAVIQNSEFRNEAAVVEVTQLYLQHWRAHPREYHWPKRPRKKRRPTTPPLWKRLDAIPTISGTLH